MIARPSLPFFCGGSKQHKSLSTRTASRTGSTSASTSRAAGRRPGYALVKVCKSLLLVAMSVRVGNSIRTEKTRSSSGASRLTSTRVRVSPGWRLHVPFGAVFSQLAGFAGPGWGLDGQNAPNSYCRVGSKHGRPDVRGAAAGEPANGTDPCRKCPRGHRSAQVGTDHRGESVPVFPQLNTSKSALGTDGTDIHRLSSRVETLGVAPGRHRRAALYGAHMQKASNLCPSRAQLIHEEPK